MFSVRKTNRLMVFGELVAVYFENHIKHTNRPNYTLRQIVNFTAGQAYMGFKRFMIQLIL
jgi:hypothetical protein